MKSPDTRTLDGPLHTQSKERATHFDELVIDAQLRQLAERPHSVHINAPQYGRGRVDHEADGRERRRAPR